MKDRHLKLAVLAASVLGVASGAHATITGSIWENTGGAWANVDTSTLNGGAGPNVTFSLPNGALNFDSRLGGDDSNNPYYTIGSWLNTGGATITSGFGEAGNTMDNVIILLTGSVSVNNGDTFTVAHDDGLVLTIGNDVVINNPGPTSPDQTIGTYSGQSGIQNFTLEYSEVMGAPAVLQLNLPLEQQLAPVPEPSTVVAGALLLLPLGVGAWRSIRKTASA